MGTVTPTPLKRTANKIFRHLLLPFRIRRNDINVQNLELQTSKQKGQGGWLDYPARSSHDWGLQCALVHSAFAILSAPPFAVGRGFQEWLWPH